MSRDMNTLQKRLFGMWDDIADMASDLDESVNVLRRQRDRGELPDPRHDDRIIMMAKALGKKITRAALTAARSARPEVTKDMNRLIIGRFYEAAGGIQELARLTGSSPNLLSVNKSRGWISKGFMYDYKKLAEEIGFDLPDSVFTPIK